MQTGRDTATPMRAEDYGNVRGMLRIVVVVVVIIVAI